jgi:hypothetical protein
MRGHQYTDRMIGHRKSPPPHHDSLDKPFNVGDEGSFNLFVYKYNTWEKEFYKDERKNNCLSKFIIYISHNYPIN